MRREVALIEFFVDTPMGRGLLAAWEKMGEGVDNSHDGDLKSHSFSPRMLTGRKEDIYFRE